MAFFFIYLTAKITLTTGLCSRRPDGQILWGWKCIIVAEAGVTTSDAVSTSNTAALIRVPTVGPTAPSKYTDSPPNFPGNVVLTTEHTSSTEQVHIYRNFNKLCVDKNNSSVVGTFGVKTAVGISPVKN